MAIDVIRVTVDGANRPLRVEYNGVELPVVFGHDNEPFEVQSSFDAPSLVRLLLEVDYVQWVPGEGAVVDADTPQRLLRGAKGAEDAGK